MADEVATQPTAHNTEENGLAEDAYYLEQASIQEDSDDDFQYEEIPDDESLATSGAPDEDYRTATQNVLEKDSEYLDERYEVATNKQRHEVVEDFVRNFLVRMNMVQTLDCFQTEWYEMKEKGLLNEEDSNTVPDIYVRNRQLDEIVNSLRTELKSYKEAAQKAKDMHLKLRKERDYHRMHHKRVVQEKDKLINDIKRMKQHYASYEPTLKALQNKYESAMKEKMLTKLERDRAVGQIQGLQQGPNFQASDQSRINRSRPCHSSNNDNGMQETTNKEHIALNQRYPMDSKFPPDNGVNPLLSKQYAPCPHLTRSGGFRLTNTIAAHSLAVSGFALHPRKNILASVGDDKIWKLWSIPDGDLVMSGEGHQDWISDCDFSPSGLHIATSSGDCTVKVWDFDKEMCVATFADHTHSVWGCSFHSCGDFLASCSMDGTSKIWDINSQRCRNTLRGHADSVNSIMFLPFSNILVTCSADKTISLWDARTGLCAQTLYGHVHSINHVTFNLKGENLASCDAYGNLKLWDVRNASVMFSYDVGPHPANKVAFDPCSTVVAVAGNDGSVKMVDIVNESISLLTAHEDAVQTVVFDKSGGEFLVSGSSDSTIRIWS